MKEVWFFFKIIETALGFICIVFHVQGITDDRHPLPHAVYFCGTFCGFTIIAIFGNISISLGANPSLLMEAVVSGIAGLFYIFSSISSMYYAEKDPHLMYLDDYEESVHPFFAISKKQGIASLLCGLMYILHSNFATDGLLITEESADARPRGSFVISKTDIECYQPIKLYIGGKEFDSWLHKQTWFQYLMGEQRNMEKYVGERRNPQV